MIKDLKRFIKMSEPEKTDFEHALDLTGFGKYNVLCFLLCSSCLLSLSFEIFSVSYLVPANACDLITTSSQQGLMAAVPMFGIIVTSYLVGYLADTRGRQKVLCYSMALGFIAGCLSSLSPDWITFCVLKFLSSSAISGSFALSMTLLAETTPAAKRNFFIVLTSSFFNCSNGIMAVIAVPVLPLKFSYYLPFLNIYFNSWRLLTLIFCAPCALCAIVLFFAHESPKYLLNVGEHEKALKVLRAIFVINKKKSADEYPVKNLYLNELTVNPTHKGFISSVVQQTTPMFKAPLLKNTVLLSILYIMVYIVFCSYLVWLPYMADGFLSSVERGDTDMTFCQMLRSSQNNTIAVPSAAANKCQMNTFGLTMVFAISMMLTAINVALSSILNCFGPKRIFIAIQFISGLAAISLVFSTIWYASAVLVIILIMGVLNFGVLSTFCLEAFPTYIKAMAMCFTLMMGRGSAVVGVNVLKMLLDQHCEASFYIFGSIIISGGLLGFVLTSEAKPKCNDIET